jgi:hypothetical protein
VAIRSSQAFLLLTPEVANFQVKISKNKQKKQRSCTTIVHFFDYLHYFSAFLVTLHLQRTTGFGFGIFIMTMCRFLCKQPILTYSPKRLPFQV